MHIHEGEVASLATSSIRLSALRPLQASGGTACSVGENAADRAFHPAGEVLRHQGAPSRSEHFRDVSRVDSRRGGTPKVPRESAQPVGSSRSAERSGGAFLLTSLP